MGIKKQSKEANKTTEGQVKEDVPGPKAYLATVIQKLRNSKAQKQSEALTEKPIGDKEIRQLISENPEMNASTFYNLLKSKGISLTQSVATIDTESQQQADSSSSNTQFLRADVKEGPKFDSCVDQVTKKGNVDNAYAVCATSLGTTKEKKKEGGPGSGRKPEHGSVVVKDDGGDKKSFGKVIVKDDTKKGGFGAVVHKQSNSISFLSNRFLEAVKGNTTGIEGRPDNEVVGFTKFKVVLLQEGMGNLKDSYWYSKDALTSAVPVFEGAKIYADHPSAIDDATRPERTVRDILGNFEEVHLEETEDGRTQLVGTVNILADESYRWARSLMEHAVDFAKKYPDKDFIGLSINANGDAQEMPIDDLINQGVPESTIPKLKKAQEQGIDSIRVVSTITDATSCDLVTEAGAGGKVLQMLEGEKNMRKKLKEAMDQQDPSKLKAEKKESEEQGHDDEQQDIELIKKMIAKYMGDEGTEEEPTSEECAVTKEACEAYKEMGYSEEEAEEAAVHHMKLAKHMAAKKKESEETEESEETKECEPKMDDEKKEAEEKKVKESMISLKAENAKLKESLRKIEINNHVDSLCAKSKLPTHITKSFKEAIGTPKSVEEVNKSWKLFEAGLKKADEELGGFAGLVMTPEKEIRAAGKSSIFDGVMKD